MSFPAVRPRRLRTTASLREMVAETLLLPQHLVWPFFIVDAPKARQSIATLPGVDRLGEAELLATAEVAVKSGLRGIALFPSVEASLKNATGSEAANPDGLVPRRVRALKARFPELLVFADVALDPYSSDGHDGLVRDGKILNDETLVALAGQAIALARAGADFVCPSDMMDGRVGHLRRALDEAKLVDTGILSYAVKYASGFYGPFRDALDSAPRFGDKKTYQMDPRNRLEALREVRLDVAEGADIVMVKPALSYLDVIREVRNEVTVPVAAYSVSGEYAMIKFGAQAKAFDEHRLMLETHLSMRRAGADLIFTYFAADLACELSKPRP